MNTETLEELVGLVDLHANATPAERKAMKITAAEIIDWIREEVVPEAREAIAKTRAAGELRIVITETPGARRPWEWQVLQWEPSTDKPGWGKWLPTYSGAFDRREGACKTERQAELEARVAAAHEAAARSADQKREATRRVIDL